MPDDDNLNNNKNLGVDGSPLVIPIGEHIPALTSDNTPSFKVIPNKTGTIALADSNENNVPIDTTNVTADTQATITITPAPTMVNITDLK